MTDKNVYGTDDLYLRDSVNEACAFFIQRKRESHQPANDQ